MSEPYQGPRGSSIPAFKIPATGQTTSLSLSITSAATAALARGVYRFVCDVEVFLAQGTGSPTAALTDMPLAASKEEYFWIGNNEKVAGILASGTGTLKITRMA